MPQRRGRCGDDLPGRSQERDIKRRTRGHSMGTKDSSIITALGNETTVDANSEYCWGKFVSQCPQACLISSHPTVELIPALTEPWESLTWNEGAGLQLSDDMTQLPLKIGSAGILEGFQHALSINCTITLSIKLGKGLQDKTWQSGLCQVFAAILKILAI